MFTIPKRILEQGLMLADGCAFYGKPLADMDREELLATAALAIEAERKATQTYAGTASTRARDFVTRCI